MSSTTEKRVKLAPNIDQMQEMFDYVETIEDDLSRLQDYFWRFDLTLIPGIGVDGLAMLTREHSTARGAVEWLGIIIGDAYNAMREKEETDG